MIAFPWPTRCTAHTAHAEIRTTELALNIQHHLGIIFEADHGTRDGGDGGEGLFRNPDLGIDFRREVGRVHIQWNHHLRQVFAEHVARTGARQRESTKSRDGFRIVVLVPVLLPLLRRSKRDGGMHVHTRLSIQCHNRSVQASDRLGMVDVDSDSNAVATQASCRQRLHGCCDRLVAERRFGEVTV